MLAVFVSGKASPGCSAAVWAAGLAWPGPALLVDADVDGGDLAAGFLAGRVSAERGLLSWAAAARGPAPALQAARLLAGHAVAVPERPQVWLLPGVSSATAGRSLTGAVWAGLALAAERAPAVLGRDVLVDAGRWCADRGQGAVLHAADRVLLVVRPSVRSVHAAARALAVLGQVLGDTGKVSALVTGPGGYTPGEVAAALGIAAAGRLPDDPRAAAALSDGPGMAWPRLARSPLLRAAGVLARRLAGDPAGRGVAAAGAAAAGGARVRG